ncbi:radical SAM family heme chaperone HemW [Cochleicola gelatinilyticus]|uniref:Heme chaperone HemW n=1 Tax=Cochleicola gelatinilyticus TaxID=1763537 RepID=A0A167IQP8_9FLAO|nr:radical SAM family heme chaperone HemW [Cochleicola gelatinilyticus]OAB79916.1 coproporphyrinogen III oxidase [Cochleicola gelatinilyticus]
MSGIYIHIPFCKQACHYCDFHFSTSLKHKQRVIDAICNELLLRKDEINEVVQTIYFGGGTPSLLTSEELIQLFETIQKHYVLSENPEITLEANPDDLSEATLEAFSKSPINRLSIGVQSFFEEDLTLMNRAHNAEEALACIKMATKYFPNSSIDLIYGVPGMPVERWIKNLDIALNLNVPHLSCYALTVEPKTALETFIKKGIVPPVEDALAAAHYEHLLEKTEAAGYENYEFSNFSKPGFYSQNNTGYWMGKPYLGVGPSGHSYDGTRRSWNVSNNTKYIKAIEAGILPIERETLSVRDRYNEYVMTRLRTIGGISLEEVAANFGKDYKTYVLQQADQHLNTKLLVQEEDRLKVTRKGKFLSDGIASDLFLISLD